MEQQEPILPSKPPPEAATSHSDECELRRDTTAAAGGPAPEARRHNLMEPSEHPFVGEGHEASGGANAMDDFQIQVATTVPTTLSSTDDGEAPGFEPGGQDGNAGHFNSSSVMPIAPSDVGGEAPLQPAAAVVFTDNAVREDVEMDTERRDELAEDTGCRRRGRGRGRGKRKLSTICDSPVSTYGRAGREDGVEMDKEDMEKSEMGAARRTRARSRRNPAASGRLLRATGGNAAGADKIGRGTEESTRGIRGRTGRKRGRPPKGQAAEVPVKRRQEKRDEYVCFICFDGGDLVLCDRRDCPKVYHPSCVNRDEAYFRAKGQWSCGWHICSNCEKSACYMCYTCTFSLCKGCVNDAGFVRMRGDKGFCVTCMSTVVMIESDKDGTKQPCDIDFDNKNSWMYLFKEYWLDLKGELSLTSEELTRANIPLKESNALPGSESSDDQNAANSVHQPSSESSSGDFEEIIFARNKAVDLPTSFSKEEASVRESEHEGTSGASAIGWASKELMEFLEHVKDGDISLLSLLDVQALLLEYIKRHNLWVPRSSDILCDYMLQNLFGKTRLGHFEMLNLLESHFLTKEPSAVVTDENQEGVVDPDSDQIDFERNKDASTRTSSDSRKKSRKRLQEKEAEANLDDYAAIDIHNVSLMYLRRNLIEDLLDDIDTFSEKVVGSFVRIRIPGAGQKQDVYRLVQVVGCGKAMKKYKSGKKATDFTLQILNLNKTEYITIDIISNQEFSEDECSCLRRSIKCGFIGRLHVVEVQEKARVLHAVRVNDWIECEKLRLSNLCDRAREQGRRKQECVDKLQALSTSEERMRMLNAVPEIHPDLKMDPDYESSEDEEETEYKRQAHVDNYGHSRESLFLGKGSEGSFLRKGDPISKWSSAKKSVHTAWENRNTQTGLSRDVNSFTFVSSGKHESSLNEEKNVQQANSLAPVVAQMIANKLEDGAPNNNQVAINYLQTSAVPSEITPPPLPGIVASSMIRETEKVWHYQDPSGKVQGPFSMTQLRKWNMTGHFPDCLRIWRASEKQENSILLNDALTGKFQKDLVELELQCDSSAHPAKVDTTDNSDCGYRMSNSATCADNKNVENQKSVHDDGFSAASNKESVRSDTWTGQPSAWSSHKSEAGSQKDRSEGWQLSNKNNEWPTCSQGPNSPRRMAPFSGKSRCPPSYQRRGGRGGWNGGQYRQHYKNPNKTMAPGGQGYERQHPNWSRESSGGHWKNQPVDNTSNQLSNHSCNMPTSQPTSMGLTGVQGYLISTSPLIAPGHAIGCSWGTKTRSEAEVPPTAIKFSSISAQATYPVGGCSSGSSVSVLTQTVKRDGGNSYRNASVPVPNKTTIAEAVDSVQILPNKDGLSIHQVLNEQIKSCRSSGLGNNKNSISACPIQNPIADHEEGDVRVPPNSMDTQDVSVAACIDLGQSKNSSEANERSRAESQSISVDDTLMNPSAGTSNTECNVGANIVAYEAGQLTISHHCNLADIKPLVVSDGMGPISDQKSGASLSMKRGSNDGSRIPASAGSNLYERIQSPKQKLSFSVPVLVGSGNLEEPPVTKSKMMPSLTPCIDLAARNASSNATASSGPNVQVLSTVGSQTVPSLWKMSTNTESAQPSSGGVGVASQNPSLATGPLLANSNMNWGMAIQGSANIGCGVVTQGDNNVVWGIPFQGNPNLTIGWGVPVQTNANTSAGWGTGVQGDINMTLGTPAQNWSEHAGWTTSAQGNKPPNLSWGAPVQGNANPTASYAVPQQVSMDHNNAWGTLLQSNTNAHGGWVAGQGNTNQTWDFNAALRNLTHDAHTSANWTTLAQGSTASYLSWDMPRLGTANSTADYPVSAQVMNQNLTWGAPLQGNTNTHGGWVAGQGNKNSNNPNIHHNQNMNRRLDQRGTSFTSSNAAHGDGRQPWSRPV